MVGANVSNGANVAALVDGVPQGEGRLDGIASNAGFMTRKPLASLALAVWSSVIGANLTAASLLARHAEKVRVSQFE